MRTIALGKTRISAIILINSQGFLGPGIRFFKFKDYLKFQDPRGSPATGFFEKLKKITTKVRYYLDLVRFLLYLPSNNTMSQFAFHNKQKDT